MATIMLLSSAITKTILKTERFAKDIWKQTFRRNIQQRRKSTGTYNKCYGRGSRACHRVTVAHNCYKGILVGEHQGENLAISVCQRVPNGLYDLFKYNHCINSRVENRKCHCAGRWTNILTTVEQLTALRSYVNLAVQSRSFLTSSRCCESEKAVGPWAAVKEKKEKIREAGQELMEDIKETKAKVREQMDAIVERENIWTIPNLLCISRIAFSPLLGYLVISGDYEWAMGLFMFAGFTDLLDGWIARAFPSQASRLGSFLDPLADKVLVALLFLSLTYVGLIPLPLTGIIIYRDVLIILGASYVRYKSLPPPKTIVRYFDATHATAQLAPTTLSKINTAIQLGLITASLAAPVFSFTDHYLLKGLCWVTAATTISSGISYIFSRDTYKILSQMKKSS